METTLLHNASFLAVLGVVGLFILALVLGRLVCWLARAIRRFNEQDRRTRRLYKNSESVGSVTSRGRLPGEVMGRITLGDMHLAALRGRRPWMDL